MLKKNMLVGICVFFLGLSTVAYAADTEVILEDDTPDSGFAVKNSSGETTVRAGGDGNVGIGTTSPSQKLDVNGGIKVGNTANATAGTIRWTGSDFEGYDGTQWVSLTSTGGSSGGGGCAPGQDLVNFGGTSICLADGATASASCTNSVWSYSGDRTSIYVSINARYTNGQVQTKASISRSGNYNYFDNCQSGWVNGLSASCETGPGLDMSVSAQTTLNGVSGSGSRTLSPEDYNDYLNLNCSTSVGAWK